MPVKYFEDEIKKHEHYYDGPFIGYINPQGMLINYSNLLGPKGHDNWRNPATLTFLSHISYVLKGSNIDRYKDSDIEYFKKLYENHKYKGSIDIKDSVIRGFCPTAIFGNHHNHSSYDDFIAGLEKEVERNNQRTTFHDEYDILKHDLIDFFGKCYSNKDFFYSLGRVISVPSEEEIRTVFDKELEWRDQKEQLEFIRDYYTYNLMNSFKDILVSYLGYDSIERAKEMPIEDMIFFDYIHAQSNGYEFLEHPSIITSCNNPYERFYNYILMDWKIQIVPRMIWDIIEKKFRESTISRLHLSDNEERIKEELEYIKSKKPLKDRYPYLKH